MQALIKPKTDSYTFEFPSFLQFEENQMASYWTPKDVGVEKDIQSLLVDCTEAERHGVITSLKLFTLYELRIGGDFWRDYVPKLFPIPEVERVAAIFSHMELNIHAPFYAKINKALNLDNDNFYTSYVKDPVLKERVNYLDSILEDETNPAAALGVFTFIEGVVLFSSFAFFKHFQNNGKNKLTNIAAGIAYSLSDEDLHSQFSAVLYKLAIQQKPELKDHAEQQIKVAVLKVLEHESLIIKKLFEHGPIQGISYESLLAFIKRRIDTCLHYLGLAPMFNETDDEVWSWFGNTKDLAQVNDFFARQGNQYTREWVKEGFKF